jgi:hypothetical protein
VSEHYYKYKKRCEPKKECIIELMPTRTRMERAAAYGGARIDEVPNEHPEKIRNYLDALNVESEKIWGKK